MDPVAEATPEPPKSVAAVRNQPKATAKPKAKASPPGATAAKPHHEPAQPAPAPAAAQSAPRRSLFEDVADDLEREWGIRE